MPNIGAYSNAIIQRTRTVLPMVFRHRSVNPVELALIEVGPAILLGCAYLYQLGKSHQNSTHAPKNRWVSAMAEGGITSALVQHTKNIYPCMGIGWAAYEMGQQKSRTDKLKAALKAAILFPMGFVGVHLGLWANDGLHYRDARTVLDKLAPLQNLLTTPAAATGATPTMAQNLQPFLARLQKGSSQLIGVLRNSQGDMRRIKEMTTEFVNSQTGLLEKLSLIAPHELNVLGTHTKDALGALEKVARRSSAYEMLRMFNPCFWYLLGVTFIGLPLVKVASNMLWPKEPEAVIPHRDFNHDIAPLWFDKVTGLGQDENLHDSIHPYLNADGPALLNQAWNSNYF